MFLTSKEIMMGEKLPPLYYGYSHRDFCRDVAYFYPIPINFIIRFGICLKFYWDKFRSKPSRLDIQIQEGIYTYLNKFEMIVDRECNRLIAEAVKRSKKANKRLDL